MSLGEILDRTFVIYRSRFFAFLAIGAVPGVAVMFVEGYAYWAWGPPPSWLQIIPGFSTADLFYTGAFHWFSFFFQLLVWPAVVVFASKIYLREEPPSSLLSELKRGFGRWKSLLSLSGILLGLAVLIPEAVAAGLLVGTAFVTSEILHFNEPAMDTVMGAAIFISCMIAWAGIGWVSANLLQSVPAFAVENLQIRAALSRGRKFGKLTRLRIFAAWLFPAITSFAAYLIVSQIIAAMQARCIEDRLFIFKARFFGQFLPVLGWCAPSGMTSALRIASDFIVSALLMPILPIAVTLFYYDQRIRLEGFDIERMMDAAGLNSTSAVAADGRDSVALEESRG
jgi:hypothetical protein